MRWRVELARLVPVYEDDDDGKPIGWSHTPVQTFESCESIRPGDGAPNPESGYITRMMQQLELHVVMLELMRVDGCVAALARSMGYTRRGAIKLVRRLELTQFARDLRRECGEEERHEQE